MKETSEQILNRVLSSGFDQVSVTMAESHKDELSVAHNEVSLMRSTENLSLDILAIRDNRKVTGSISNTDPDALQKLVDAMIEDVETTPADKANGIAANQKGSFQNGPQMADSEALAHGADRLLQFRSRNYPSFQIEEAAFEHNLVNTRFLSSEGSKLESSHGFYRMLMMGSSKDQYGSSSFNYTGGIANQLPEPIEDHFDIQSIMGNSVLETNTSMIPDKFTGDIVLMPNAVSSLLGWIFRQLGDTSLLQDTSLYKNSVGQSIASDLFNLSHITEVPGAAPFNEEGFLLQPFPLIKKGQLNHLLPSYFGSRKLGIPHQPGGWAWEVQSGDTALDDMIESVRHGALVGRLSMGAPASNGDFAGVIKNSFLIEKGKRTKALSETMITGNIARMLKDISAISREFTDYGYGSLPYILIQGLKFS